MAATVAHTVLTRFAAMVNPLSTADGQGGYGELLLSCVPGSAATTGMVHNMAADVKGSVVAVSLCNGVSLGGRILQYSSASGSASTGVWHVFSSSDGKVAAGTDLSAKSWRCRVLYKDVA